MRFVELLWLALLPLLLTIPWLLRRRLPPDFMALLPGRAESLAAYEGALAPRLEWLDDACARARAAATRGEAETSARLLASAHAIAAGLLADLARDLARWHEQSAPLHRALAPEPVPLRDLRLGRLKALALGVTVVHALLVTPRERLRWQLRALRRCLDTLRAAWPEPAAPHDARKWRRIEAARHDLHSLARAALDAYAALLFSRQFDLGPSNADS